MTNDDIDTKSWTQIAAMERSHTWRIVRYADASKSCKACGDTFMSAIRYCPGTGAVAVATATETLTVPPLEEPGVL